MIYLIRMKLQKKNNASSKVLPFLAWKTIIIEKSGQITLDNHQIQLTDKDGAIELYPLAEIDVIFIENPIMMISYPFLSYCMEHHIHLAIMNHKHLLVGGVIPHESSHHRKSKIHEQLRWKQSIKDRVWQSIIINKIQNQHEILLKSIHQDNKVLIDLVEHIQQGDKKNHEGQASKIYFKLLFGDEFRRHAHDGLNAALDYGYSLLHSLIQRNLILMGYHTGFGLHHKSQDNPYNLSYDLIEPFRPLVDYIVFNNSASFKETLDKQYLRDVLNQRIKVLGVDYELKQAMKIYLDQVFKFLRKPKSEEFPFITIN